MFNKKITKEESKLMEKLFVGSEKERVKNPISGDCVVLEPEAVALYDYIIGCSITGICPKDYHLAMSLFSKQWSREYRILLD